MEVRDFDSLDKKISCDRCPYSPVYEKLTSCILVLDRIVNHIYYNSTKVAIMGNTHTGPLVII